MAFHGRVYFPPLFSLYMRVSGRRKEKRLLIISSNSGRQGERSRIPPPLIKVVRGWKSSWPITREKGGRCAVIVYRYQRGRIYIYISVRATTIRVSNYATTIGRGITMNPNSFGLLVTCLPKRALPSLQYHASKYKLNRGPSCHPQNRCKPARPL